jgi:hypothetical protein
MDQALIQAAEQTPVVVPTNTRTLIYRQPISLLRTAAKAYVRQMENRLLQQDTLTEQQIEKETFLFVLIAGTNGFCIRMPKDTECLPEPLKVLLILEWQHLRMESFQKVAENLAGLVLKEKERIEQKRKRKREAVESEAQQQQQ